MRQQQEILFLMLGSTRLSVAYSSRTRPFFLPGMRLQHRIWPRESCVLTSSSSSFVAYRFEFAEFHLVYLQSIHACSLVRPCHTFIASRHCPFGHLEVKAEWRPANSVPKVIIWRSITLSWLWHCVRLQSTRVHPKLTRIFWSPNRCCIKAEQPSRTPRKKAASAQRRVE